MRITSKLTTFGAIAWLGLLPLSVLGKEAAEPGSVTVEEAQFGRFTALSGGKVAFVPTDRVPNRPRQSYGWIIRVKTGQKTVHWREEFTLPSAPAHWDKNAPNVLSPDRTTSITERTAKPENGMLMNAWSVAPGDPSGKYVMRVYIEGRLVRTFDFTVE